MATRRSPFLSAAWQHLVMLNYAIEPGLLQKYVPAGTELDCWNGKCLISLVGLLFSNTRVLGLAVPYYQNYEEVNLRFYVRRQSNPGWKRGVVFIKQIVPRRAIALIACRVYREKFVFMPMSHVFEALPGPGQPRRVSYQWFHLGDWNRMSAQVSGEPVLPSSGSLEEFVVERHWGYNPRPNGPTLEYQVERPQWRIWKAEQAELVCDVARLYGPEFVESLNGLPASAFVGEGSKVVVYKGTPI